MQSDVKSGPALNTLLTIGEELGYLTPEQLSSVDELQRQMRAVGVKIPIGQLLLERKYVTTFQLKEMREVLVRRVAGAGSMAVAEPTPIMRFGHFDVLEMISEKERSRVYKARDTKMNRTVALKLLLGNALNDRHWLARFQRETELTGKLIHPNIATAYGCGTVDNRPFLTMEFVDGLPVGEKLEREGNLPEGTTWRIAREVLKALIFASSLGVLHRDIKPDNIIVSRNGQVKLIDLGLSKLQSESRDLTMVGTTVGTAFYISPEQAHGEINLDIRSDLYSLGCTVFQMLTGSVPFYSENFLQVMRMQATAPRPDPRSVLPEISAESAELVMRMMALERRERPEPSQLLGEIDALVEAMPDLVSVRPALEVQTSELAPANTAAGDDLAPARPQPPSRDIPPPASPLDAAVELGLVSEGRAQNLRRTQQKLRGMGIDMPMGSALLQHGYIQPGMLDRISSLLKSRGYSRRRQTVLPESPRFGAFELLRELSAKGHSTIYHARDREMKRYVALRVVPGASDSARLERFQREVRILARLIHGNIVLAYGAGEYNGSSYMATEYVDGISLAERIELEGRIAERTAWRIAREIARGLTFAASQGVCHRDIKPENVLCGYDGQVKIIDFGLSKSREDEGLTLMGTTVGTPYYMPPEQARGTAALDIRSDIYSLGCTVYHMLTGVVPFYRDEFLEVMQLHTQAPRPDASRVRKDLTAESARLVQRMMSIHVDARPESGAELLEAIDRLLEILPDDAQRNRLDRPAEAGPVRYKSDTSTVINAVKYKTPAPMPATVADVPPPPPPAPARAASKTQAAAPVYRSTPRTSAFAPLKEEKPKGFFGWLRSLFS